MGFCHHIPGVACDNCRTTWTVHPQHFSTTTVRYPSGPVECLPTAHDFDRLDPKRIYCRKCGTTRTV